MTKSANTQYPILPAISERWSPRSFTGEVPEKETLMRLFEAARWAASGGNRQPWFFILTEKGSERYDQLFNTLNTNNKTWAKSAPLLLLTITNTIRSNGHPNAYAGYDLGQAVANLATQATAEGLFLHQMGGFDRNKAAELFHLPEGYEAMTAIAIGYLGQPDALDDELREREVTPRSRKELNTFVFDGEWEKAF